MPVMLSHCTCTVWTDIITHLMRPYLEVLPAMIRNARALLIIPRRRTIYDALYKFTHHHRRHRHFKWKPHIRWHTVKTCLSAAVLLNFPPGLLKTRCLKRTQSLHQGCDSLASFLGLRPNFLASALGLSGLGLGFCLGLEFMALVLNALALA